ncbi:uncharacterized protein LOC130726564 [Lotus japonicus]|uniref:uncharacterized protein LOC130726564 n=1 Tax=Lotus japonicus TaxID=34305 RepID=UPI00258D61E5|nr:uncharacterized protein LOC130726564 [Lotus japonicus]
MGQWSDGVWKWKFKWRRRLRGREVGWLDDLMKELLAICLTENKNDKWSWRLDGEGVYSVNSSYLFLQEQILEEVDPVFKLVWSVPVPSNVIAFSWRMLKDRIQTRNNLHRRRVITNEDGASCPLCGLEDESTSHLFYLCQATNLIWYACSNWLGVPSSLLPSPREHLLQFPSIGTNKAQRVGEYVIWMSIVWTIWLLRNKTVFNGEEFDRNQVLELAQFKAWQWLRTKTDGFTYSWFEWLRNPSYYIQAL